MKIETREKDGVLQIKVGRYWLDLEEHLERQDAELQRARDEVAELYEENRKLREPKPVETHASEDFEDEEFEEVTTVGGEKIIFYPHTSPPNHYTPTWTSGTNTNRISNGTYTGKVTFSFDPANIDKDVINKLTNRKLR